jgi:hypothetical protein
MTDQTIRTTETTFDQEWALSFLELSEQVPYDEQMGRILEKLEHVEFMPSREWREAIEILANGSTQGSAMRAQQRIKLAERIQRFLKEYWSLSIEQRRREYQTLSSEAIGFPETLMALERVELGLDVDDGRLNFEKDVELMELGRLICEQFLMGQSARVQSRRRWQSEHTNQEQRKIARRLKSYYPGIAALEEAWIHRLLRNEPYYVPPKSLMRKVIHKTSEVANASMSSDWAKVLLIVIGTIVGVVVGMSLDPSPRPTPFYYKPPSPKIEIPRIEFPTFRPNMPPGRLTPEQTAYLLFPRQ